MESKHWRGFWVQNVGGKDYFIEYAIYKVIATKRRRLMETCMSRKLPYCAVDSDIIAPTRLYHVLTVEPRESTLHVYGGTELQRCCPPSS